MPKLAFLETPLLKQMKQEGTNKNCITGFQQNYKRPIEIKILQNFEISSISRE